MVGAEDVAAPAGCNPPPPTVVPTSTGPTFPPTAPGPTSTPTATPTPTGAAAIVVNLVATQFKWSFNGGGSSLTMKAGQTHQPPSSDGGPPRNDQHGVSRTPAPRLSPHRPRSPRPPPPR